MSAILKFDFQKKKITFFWSKLSKLHKKRPNIACDNYIFPKTRGNKNKQWTHSTPIEWLSYFSLPFVHKVVVHLDLTIFKYFPAGILVWNRHHIIMCTPKKNINQQKERSKNVPF